MLFPLPSLLPRPFSVLQDLRYFKIVSPTGASMSLFITGLARLPRPGNSIYGSVVIIVTQIGQITMDGANLFFSTTVSPIFQEAGFAVTSSTGGRKLLGLYELVGFFNSESAARIVLGKILSLCAKAYHSFSR